MSRSAVRKSGGTTSRSISSGDGLLLIYVREVTAMFDVDILRRTGRWSRDVEEERAEAPLDHILSLDSDRSRW